jgi:hypothetical protein
VLSVNGSTGTITNIARTIVDNNFIAAQTIASTSTGNATTVSPTSLTHYYDASGFSQLWQSAEANSTITFPDFTTTLAGLAGTQTFGGTKTFNALTSFNAGISASGGTFNSIVIFNAGLSASGGTFANDIRVNSMTIGRGTANIDTNIAFGASAYFSGTTGANNVAIGLNALRLNQAGDINTAIGAGALQSNVNGRNNVAIGWSALKTLNTTTWSAASQAEYNVAIGGNALGAATIASNNMAIGAAAAQNVTTSSSNVAIGTFTLLRCGAGGGDNVAIGNQAMVGSGAVTTQGYNTSIGANSMFNIAAANYNTAIGHSALFSSTTGQNNTVMGANALYHATASSNSVAIGYEAGRYAGITGGSNLTSSTNSIFIGDSSKSGFTTSSNEIVIGRNAVGLGSNTAVIGATAQTSATIYGLLNAPSGISAAGATLSGNINILAGFTAGAGSGNCFMAFIPSPSSANGGLWIQNGNLQIGGSVFGVGNGGFNYSPNNEVFSLFGQQFINQSFNYQSGRAILRLNAGPAQSVPIFAAYKQTVEGTAITSTYSATNMVAGIDQNGVLFSTAGVTAAGGTFSSNVQAATFTETSNSIRVTNNARSWFL